MAADKRDFMAGLVLGGLLGAGLALLLAPRTGEEARLRLRERGAEMGQRTREKAEEIGARAAAKAEEIRSRTREKVEELRDRTQDALRRGREEVLGRFEERKSSLEDNTPLG